MTAISSQIHVCHESHPLHTQRFHPGKATSKIRKKSANQHTPVAPGQSKRSRQLSAAPIQLTVSTTRQQHQISYQFLPPGSSTKISYQFLPPGRSTKSASSFYHQAAAPNQLPVSTTRQ